MWNIMKALNYQTKRDNLIIYAALFAIVLLFGNVLIESGFDLEGLNGGLFFANYGSIYPMMFAIVFVIVVPRICGWDATDKTMNYEIMAGHSRKEVYFGRVIVSLIWSMLIGIVIMILPAIFFTMINGWGENVNGTDMVIRYLLVLFPMFRLICELILLSFLLQNCYVAMLIGWVLLDASIIGSMVYTELTEKSIDVQLAVMNLTTLFGFDNYKIEYINGEDIQVFDTRISATMAQNTILVSLVVGIMCLFIGYAVFRKRDMN